MKTTYYEAVPVENPPSEENYYVVEFREVSGRAPNTFEYILFNGNDFISTLPSYFWKPISWLRKVSTLPEPGKVSEDEIEKEAKRRFDYTVTENLELRQKLFFDRINFANGAKWMRSRLSNDSILEMIDEEIKRTSDAVFDAHHVLKSLRSRIAGK